jgi:hypothetical protein
MVVNPKLADPASWNLSDQRGLASQFVTNAIRSGALGMVFALLGMALVLVSVASLVVRFRRARGVERQQLKWPIYAWAVAAVANLVVPLSWTAGILSWVVNWAIPAAIAVAILRYHLYDIDRLINRTLVYGLVTATLGLGYAGVVLVLGQLFGGIPSEPPSWAIAAATLAVAALFRPARRRVQQLVDQRFNRRRYDAAKTIEGFSVHLRDSVDLDTLSAELLAVVDQTMEPTVASLWLRPPVDRSGRPYAMEATHR